MKRREWDSNPRGPEGPQALKACALSTLPSRRIQLFLNPQCLKSFRRCKRLRKSSYKLTLSALCVVNILLVQPPIPRRTYLRRPNFSMHNSRRLPNYRIIKTKFEYVLYSEKDEASIYWKRKQNISAGPVV